ncbi:alpha-(1-_3)-arabinofuranosyltransferase domain-containing protein [Streptomyces sp. NPDC002851]
MTSTAVQAPQLPPQTPDPATGTRAGPPEEPRSRRWLFGFWAVVFVAFLAVSPGRMTFETKLGVAADPWKFLGDLGELWHDRAGFGGIFDQYIGYAFPSLPFYGLADLAQLPVWLAERLWMSLIVATAFWGALRLAERLGIGSSSSRALGAVAYALWPTFTIVVGSTSAAALPGAVLPWVVLPLTNDRVSARVAALRSALIIPCMGGVNAASTLASLLPVGLYLLSRPAGPRQRKLIAWWVPGVLLATAWWVVPLLLLGIHGENFLPYVESARTTTDTMSATETLRGAGNWVAYLHFGEAWLPAGWTVATGGLVIVCSALAAAFGLAGLARRDLPERRWLVLTVLTVVLVTMAGYGGAFGGPFHETMQDWLDGWLVPFRNIYKFQTGLALALAFGLMHLVGVAAVARGARARLPDLRGPATPGTAPRRTAASPTYAQYEGDTTARRCTAPDAAGRSTKTGKTGPGPVRGRRFAVLVAALLVLPGLALPYVNGSILQPGAFKELPGHWKSTAAWLKKYSPDSRALVVPATAHGIYTWGSPIDQPLDVLADSRWAQRDYVPFGTAGNRRALDAVEQALLTGGEVPGLQDFLSRSGLHYVVVRNDLDPDQLGYVPTPTVKRTLESSGYRRITGFGPKVTGGRIADDTPVQVEGLYPRQQAVEIYGPDEDAAEAQRPGQAGLKPVADTAVVSGGPESLLPLSADPTLRDRPAVLTGDNHPGLGKAPLQAVGDGMRRADTRFGLITSNTSYPYTPDERNHPESTQNPGEPPKQILPKGLDDIEHQTTAGLRGAKSVTASSYGHWLFHLPQYDPVNAFDGNGDTAWAEGSAASPDGEWLRIGFDGPVEVPDRFSVQPLPQNGVRPAPTKVRVETERGSAVSNLQPNGQPQQINSPRGSTRWLKLTILDTESPRPGLSGAGFAEVSVPDVQVTRLLDLPKDAERTGRAQDTDAATATRYSLHRSAGAGGLDPTGAVLSAYSLHRRFDTAAPDTYDLTAKAVAVPGEALDKLLYDVAPQPKKRLTATADATGGLGRNLSPRNLTDGDLTTAWIAGGTGNSAVIHLRWPDKKPVGEIVLAAAGGLSARPEKVEISSPDGAATAGVDENGLARFEPITTDRLDITITKTAPLTLHNPFADAKTQLPVGLTEVYLPALAEYRTEQPDPDRTFDLACGEGPPLAVDGTLHATRVKGTVGDLLERRPVDVELCAGEQKNGRVNLGAGTHTVEAGDDGPLAVTDVTLTRGEVPELSGSERDLTVRDWAGDRRELSVEAGPASYLTMYENANDGWKATLDGEKLTPVRLDGWQQGWLIPDGASGTVKLEYEPARTYEAGLIGGGVAVLLLVGLVLFRRRADDRRQSTAAAAGPAPAPPAPGLLLGTVALTAVGVAVAGWFAALVPVLAVVAWRRRGLLVPLAFLAMAGAGIAAALGAGGAVTASAGAFSATAQLLAVGGLFAALVSGRLEGEREVAAPVGGGATGEPGGSGAAEGPPPPLPPDAPGAVPPLPRRQRIQARSGPTVSARGPDAAQPDPPTTPIPVPRRPRLRPTPPTTDGEAEGPEANEPREGT